MENKNIGLELTTEYKKIEELQIVVEIAKNKDGLVVRSRSYTLADVNQIKARAEATSKLMLDKANLLVNLFN